MPIIRAQVTIPYDSNLPEDVVVNTFHFNVTTANQTAHDVIAAMLADFYGTVPEGAAGAISAFLSANLNSANASIRTYDLSQAEPRQPIDVTNPGWTWAGAGAFLPEELAVCLSFQAVGVSGEPQARRRGRVYIGPLGQNALETTGNRPEQDFIDRLVAAAQTLKDESITNAARWVVYSEAAGGVGYNVDNGWCDNAFDVQRRRGVAATSRTLWGP